MKRVLIIVYYWPPSGGAGVQRWLKFSKYLPEFGWKPIIYTPENPDFELKDESLLKEIHPEVEVIKRPIWEPYSAYRKIFSKEGKKEVSTGLKEKDGMGSKIANWIRGNFFVPDPKIFWRKPSVNFLATYLKENPVDLIISSGTPHSMHLIALDLKKSLGLPWIADFRDPWSELDMLNDYYIHPLRMKKYRALEKEVLSAADMVITASNVWADDFKRLGAKRSYCITNGFDEEDFKVEVEPYNDWVLSHFGLLNHLRNPRYLWQAIEELLQEDQEFSNKFKLHLGGTIDTQILDELKKYPHLSERIKIFPYLNHEQVIKEYLKSKVLLLLLFNSESGRGNIPGKLFEYLASKKPIVGFGPDIGDSAEIIAKNNGEFILYSNNNIKEIKEKLRSLFDSSNKAENNVLDYSRYELTRKLVDLIKLIFS